MVTDAVEAHQVVDGGLDLVGAAPHVGVHGLAPRAVLVGDAEREHPRPVVGLPPEQPARQPLLMRSGAHEDVGRQPALGQDLREHARVPEAVGVEPHRGGDPQLLGEPALPDQRLPGEGLTAGDVAVGLDPPAADHLPAALGHPLLDLVEHRGVGALNPVVERRGGRGVDEVVVLRQPVQRRAERRLDLLEALRPLPQPHRVDVGVADEVQRRARAGRCACGEGVGGGHVRLQESSVRSRLSPSAPQH